MGSAVIRSVSVGNHHRRHQLRKLDPTHHHCRIRRISDKVVNEKPGLGPSRKLLRRKRRVKKKEVARGENKAIEQGIEANETPKPKKASTCERVRRLKDYSNIMN